MTTNQTIDGVPRKLLTNLLAWLERANERNDDGDIAEYVELRALLDKEVSGDSRAPLPLGEPFGYWLFPKGLPLHGMFHRVTETNKIIDSQSVVEAFEITPLYAEQGAPVAVAPLEVVGRQCFPSEAMKAVHGYRKEPWVDGEVDQVPSEPEFYRVEPLVRLSDVTAPVAVVMPDRANAMKGSHDHQSGWNACLDEVTRLNTK